MKFLVSQLAAILSEREVRQNLRGLYSFIAFLVAMVVFFSLSFHAIMLYEGKEHSWLTGLYWTLTVMSTLGFGDITFESDLGRAFSIFVLVSGIVMLLILLPFTFIRYFYAPWLEAQVRLRAPRRLRDDVWDHVILCHHDPVTRGLVPWLERQGVSYVVIEPDPVEAAALHSDGVSVVAGPRDSAETYQTLRIDEARLAFVNGSDAENTNIILTIRELNADLPIATIAEDFDSVDVLQLSGASSVLALKHELGEQLASRITVGTPQAHRIGRYKDVVIAEFPLYHTALPGRTIRDTHLRQITGLNIVGVWERGKLMPAGPDTMLSENTVPIVVGTEEQMTELDALFVIYPPNDNPVLVVGGGKVGVATARALKRRDISVTILERDPAMASVLAGEADRVVIGDASNRQCMLDAGIADAPSVVLSTNNDATNIFLSIYCRRLAPDAHIVSRITEEWNLEAIHRAGADFVLSYNALAVKRVMALVENRELVVVGEGASLFVEAVPPGIAGKSLAESEIGARTGLNVIAVDAGGASTTNPGASVELPAEGDLVMLGTAEQHERFKEEFC